MVLTAHKELLVLKEREASRDHEVFQVIKVHQACPVSKVNGVLAAIVELRETEVWMDKTDLQVLLVSMVLLDFGEMTEQLEREDQEENQVFPD